MAYEARTFQSSTTNTPPTGTDPLVDNTASGDVQAIKLINPTAGSVAPWINQAARTQSLPVALSTEDAALLADLLTNTTFAARLPAALGAGGGLKIDGSGTVLPVSAAALPLPSGASTEATLSTLNGKVPALGQALAAASVPVILPSATITTLTPPAAITGFATQTTLASIDTKVPALGQALAAASVPVILPAATVTTLTPPAAITGFALETTQTTQSGLFGALTETAPASDTASSGLNGRLQRIAQRLTSLITALGSPFQAGGSIGNTSFASTQSGTWTVQPGNTANTTPWLVKETRATTGTCTNVSASASSVSLLAANTARIGFRLFNDSSALAYVKFAATASTTSYTAIIAANDYLEETQHSGIVDCIWSSATGAMRITELS